MTDTDPPLVVDRRDHVAVLTLNRPDRRNALNRELVAAIAQAGAELLLDDSVRAVVLTGAGDKAFCAGADLKERAGMTDAEVRTQIRGYETAFGWLEDPRIVSVAAINAVALGGGLEIALCCDLRVAQTRAILGLPETSLAIIPAAGGTQRLPRIIGSARAKEMILLGKRVSAEQALGIGLVHHVVPDDADLLEETLRYITPVSDGAPLAQRAALAAIAAASELPLYEGLHRERELYEQCLSSEDRSEALRAFAEKRAPRFTGR